MLLIDSQSVAKVLTMAAFLYKNFRHLALVIHR